MGMNLTNEMVISTAKRFGFELVGFAEAKILDKEIEHLEEWLSLAYNGDMNYMERNTEKRKDVKNILPGAKSIISLGMIYYNPETHSDDPDKGKISRYAWGKDYHLIIWDKLEKLIGELKESDPSFEAVSYIDTGPVMDKAWAVRSGLGWLGKHTNVINKENGSWFFIANIICNYQFIYSIPVGDYCGSCTACIDACPTGAIVEEYILDANKCISYLTIENKGEISQEFKGKFNNWVFGCDICQDVCPWNNKFSQVSAEKDFSSKNENKEVNLLNILSMEQEEFNRKFKESPVKRTKLKGLKRNAKFILSI